MKTVTVTLEFEDHDNETANEAKRILNANNAYRALRDISDEIFRPARKHGYSDSRIQAIMAENGAELIGLLEEKFREILEEYDIRGDI